MAYPESRTAPARAVPADVHFLIPSRRDWPLSEYAEGGRLRQRAQIDLDHSVSVITGGHGQALHSTQFTVPAREQHHV